MTKFPERNFSKLYLEFKKKYADDVKGVGIKFELGSFGGEQNIKLDRRAT